LFTEKCRHWAIGIEFRILKGLPLRGEDPNTAQSAATSSRVEEVGPQVVRAPGHLP